MIDEVDLKYFMILFKKLSEEALRWVKYDMVNGVQISIKELNDLLPFDSVTKTRQVVKYLIDKNILETKTKAGKTWFKFKDDSFLFGKRG